MLDTTTTIVNIIDAKDEYTRGHSTRVAQYSRQLARALGWVPQHVEQLSNAALLHDIGKIREISAEIGFPYTSEGRLLGHITMSCMMVQEAAAKLRLPSSRLEQLQHILLSHHGDNEKGSPVACSTREAFVVHYADEINAVMNQFDVHDGKSAWEFNRMLGRNILVDKL